MIFGVKSMVNVKATMQGKQVLDRDLDLAFIALDRKGDNAESWSCEPVDISSDAELDYLDDVVYLGESMRFQPSIRIGKVHTIIQRPRRLYATSSAVTGGASFNAQGQFVGLGVRNTGGSGGEFMPYFRPSLFASFCHRRSKRLLTLSKRTRASKKLPRQHRLPR